MASTVWKGFVTFGLISIPVRLLRAARPERVKLRQLERHDLRSRPSRTQPWAAATALWAARRTLRASPVPPGAPEAPPRREVEAEAVSS